MNTSIVRPSRARARSVEFVPDALVVHLEDGRTLSVPLEWFPRLRGATPEQRAHWRKIGPGSPFCRWSARATGLTPRDRRRARA